MLDRRHRFHGLGSLNPAYRRGVTVRSPWFSMKYVQNQRRDTYRCAVVVSRKVHKSAVVRNRIRRRVYEVLRHDLAKTSGAYDIVITVFSDQAADADSAKLAVMLHQLIASAHLR